MILTNIYLFIFSNKKSINVTYCEKFSERDNTIQFRMDVDESRYLFLWCHIDRFTAVYSLNFTGPELKSCLKKLTTEITSPQDMLKTPNLRLT